MGEENSIQQRIELSMLYDFYGALLKENQREMYEAFILEDFSVTEIAQNMGITRQGVHDAVKRATRQLREYEEKLGLVERFENQRELLKQLYEKLREMDFSEEQPKWREILLLLEHIVEEAD